MKIESRKEMIELNLIMDEFEVGTLYRLITVGGDYISLTIEQETLVRQLKEALEDCS